VVSSEPIWHPGAIVDAEDARNWYAARSVSAAREFLRALDEAVEAIIEAPERWPRHRFGCRRYLFANQFPFALIYRQSSHLEIVAVAHHRRKPDYWKRR
jgi:plasmid stabilization system protein ParE